MLIDARSLPDGAQLQCDLAVIGAGPAGLGIVDRLRASGLRICLLEGGGLEQTVRAQRLYRGEITGHPHYPLHTSRFRVFGGSGNRWGGWCHPLEPIDFEHRPQLPWSGWPVSAADLDRYNKDTAELLGLTTDDFGSASWRDRLPPGLPIEGGDFENAIFQISPRRDFGGAYRDRLRDSADVTVVLNANVTELRLDPGTDRVGTLRARTLRGNELSVRGRAVVLAAGAIENARLLLASRHDRAAGLGNERDQVGRNFMEHLHVLAGHLVVANPSTTHDLYREASYGAARVRGVITPTAEAQRREGLLGASIAIEPPTFPYGQPFLTAPPQLTVWPERAYRRLRRSNRGAGAVVNVASLLAFSSSLPPDPLPQRVTYAACKAYIVSFTQLLAHELEGSGVRVQVLCPGLVRTEFHEVAGRDPSKLPFRIMEPEDVVDASLRGLELGEVVCAPGLEDPQLVDTLDEAHRTVFRDAIRGVVAPRYRARI